MYYTIYIIQYIYIHASIKESTILLCEMKGKGYIKYVYYWLIDWLTNWRTYELTSWRISYYKLSNSSRMICRIKLFLQFSVKFVIKFCVFARNFLTYDLTSMGFSFSRKIHKQKQTILVFEILRHFANKYETSRNSVTQKNENYIRPPGKLCYVG